MLEGEGAPSSNIPSSNVTIFKMLCIPLGLWSSRSCFRECLLLLYLGVKPLLMLENPVLLQEFPYSFIRMSHSSSASTGPFFFTVTRTIFRIEFQLMKYKHNFQQHVRTLRKESTSYLYFFPPIPAENPAYNVLLKLHLSVLVTGVSRY